MLNATAAIAFILIFALEATVIITGNVVTIFVFKNQSGHPSETNSSSFNQPGRRRFASESRRSCTPGVSQDSENWHHILKSSQAFGSFLSVMFLALISLERVHVVFQPLRYLIISTQASIFSIVGSWIMHWWTVFVNSILLTHG